MYREKQEMHGGEEHGEAESADSALAGHHTQPVDGELTVNPREVELDPTGICGQELHQLQDGSQIRLVEPSEEAASHLEIRGSMLS